MLLDLLAHGIKDGRFTPDSFGEAEMIEMAKDGEWDAADEHLEKMQKLVDAAAEVHPEILET